MVALEEYVSEARQTGNWDRNSWAMRVYAGALGQIGDQQAIPLLKKMLDAPPQRTKAPTPKYLVADTAARALRSLDLEVTGDVEKGGYKLVTTVLNTEIKSDIKQERI
jgi:HEAT repeat protein